MLKAWLDERKAGKLFAFASLFKFTHIEFIFTFSIF